MLQKLIISFVAPLVLNPLLTPTPKVDKLPHGSEVKAYKTAPAWETVKVTKVYDGDTFTATRNGELIRVRVTWADTPELKTKQFYAKEARDIMVKALAANDAEIQVVGTSFDRLVAHVRTKKIGNVGLYLIQQGAGKAYPTCRKECPETWKMVREAEKLAKKLKLGIWQQAIDPNQNIAEV
jgi:endonuclease YncB( thermonuclease family)